jgi:parvulin-like peptidyl-prolyl isomerase
VRRPLSVLAAVLGAAFLLSACGSGPASPTAAKVNSTRILRSELNDQLAVLSDNTEWLNGVSDRFGEKTLAAPNGNVSAVLAATWLTALMNQAVVDEEFEQKNLKVTDENRQAAQASAEQLFSTDDGSTFDTMPKWFRDDFVKAQARYEAVAAVVPENPAPTTKDIEPLLQGAFAQYCNQGSAVSHILVGSRAEADRIEADLAAGADFQELAKTQSLDTGSKDLGGFLSCTGSVNYPQLPEAFRQAVAGVPEGTISAPIQTDVGFHVVKVSKFDLENVRVFLGALYTNSLEAPMVQFVNNQLLKAKLWVDPRYGTLGRGPVRVNPPKAPQVRNRPPNPASSGSS